MYVKYAGIKPGRITFNVINVTILIFLAAVTLYPFLYILAASFSSNEFVIKGKFGILPEGFNIEAYKAVFRYPLMLSSYKNSVIYTVLGTFVNLLLTCLGAYTLSRKKFYGRKFFMFIIVFTMLFNAGTVPTFIIVQKLDLIDSIWSMVLPTAVSAYYLIIMRTFFLQIPSEIEEAAAIDGCTDLQTMFRVILPMSVPSMLTVGLFYAVDNWNRFFEALLYLNDKNMFPLTILLRMIVVLNQTDEIVNSNPTQVYGETIKYAAIILIALPMLCLYPFIQRYFVKGIMIGAIKG